MQKNKKLKATVDYDKKIAMSFFKKGFYEYEQDRIRNLFKSYMDKQSLKTSHKEDVSDIIKQYRNFCEYKELKIFNALKRIRDLNMKHISKGLPLPKHKDIMSLISNPFVILQAYRTIRTKKGAMTEGAMLPPFIFNNLTDEEKKVANISYSLPDGMSWDIILTLSACIKKGKFPWGASRRIWIPKPGRKDSLRPITIPPFGDKIVQECIRMVLEAIYEPTFQRMNCSFGFRASVGCHEAIISIRDNSKGFTTAIEGDIEAAYPSMDHDIFIKILRERISDRRFLDMVRNRFKTVVYSVKEEKYEISELGIPQGGIDSPYYWNIYLLGMDNFIKERISQMVDQENKKRLRGLKRFPINKVYQHYKNQKEARERKYLIHQEKFKLIQSLQNVKKFTLNKDLGNKDFIISQDNSEMSFKSYKIRKRYINLKNSLNEEKGIVFSTIKEIKESRRNLINTPYRDPKTNKLRFHYVRYADDFIITGNFSRKFAVKIKTELSEWLMDHRKLKLSDKKTFITNLLKEPARFLGFEITGSMSRRFKYIDDARGNTYLKRTTGWNLTIGPDRERMINRLFMKGYCDRKGFPKSVPWLIGFEPHIIVERFNSIIRGFAEFYTDFITYRSMLNRWIYILRYSCFHTLAQKYNSTIKKILIRFADTNNRNNISIQFILFAKDPDGKIRPLIKTWSLITYSQAIILTSKSKDRIISKKLKSISEGNFDFAELENPQRTPRIMDMDFLQRINWVNLRTQANFDMPCCVCGFFGKINMHHVKQIKKEKYSLIPKEMTLKRMMSLRNRKQVPLCEKCHKEVHNKPSFTIPDFRMPILLYDNRIIDSERFIHVGRIHYAPPYPENFYKKGWEDFKPKN